MIPLITKLSLLFLVHWKFVKLQSIVWFRWTEKYAFLQSSGRRGCGVESPLPASFSGRPILRIGMEELEIYFLKVIQTNCSLSSPHIYPVWKPLIYTTSSTAKGNWQRKDKRLYFAFKPTYQPSFLCIVKIECNVLLLLCFHSFYLY